MKEARDLIEVIRTRRSVRRYRPGEVSRKTLETIVDCGRLAPTSNNRQTWEFMVVTRKETLRELARLARHGRFIAESSACIVVASDPRNDSLYLDGAAATENMLLAIHALGLASCWVQAYNKDYTPKVRELLAIPDSLELVSIVPVAHPAGETSVPTKRALEEVLHWEVY